MSLGDLKTMMKMLKTSKEKEPMEMPEMRPMIHFSAKQLPQASSWEVGKTYNLKLKVKQTSMSKREGEKGEYGFEILGVETMANDKPKTKPKKVTRYQEE